MNRSISCIAFALLCAHGALGDSAAPAPPAGSGTTVDAASKPNGKWQPLLTRSLADLPGLPENPSLDRYGGLAKDPLKATGFFRTEKYRDRWWLVDPDGGRFLNVGLATVYPYTSPATRPTFDAKYGDMTKWAEAAATQLRGFGFNGLGPWSDLKSMCATNTRVPYTRMLNFMVDYAKQRGGSYAEPGKDPKPQDCVFVFEPGFDSFCEERAKHLAEFKADPWLIGYFSDNELPFFRLPFFRDLLDKFMALPAEDPGAKVARAWLAARHAGPPTDPDRMAFLGTVADRYYSVTTRAIRKYDPNHLCLGSRFWETDLDRPELWVAAGKYLDVVSVNYYHAWTPQPERLEMWGKMSGKPFLVSEFYAKGMDSGLPNTSGAGWCVRTQRDRGSYYQHFALGLLECRSCVGWHWFRYMDNDPDAPSRGKADQDSNKGIVDIRYQAYMPLVDAMRALNRRTYTLIDYFDCRRTPMK